MKWRQGLSEWPWWGHPSNIAWVEIHWSYIKIKLLTYLITIVMRPVIKCEGFKGFLLFDVGNASPNT